MARVCDAFEPATVGLLVLRRAAATRNVPVPLRGFKEIDNEVQNFNVRGGICRAFSSLRRCQALPARSSNALLRSAPVA